MTGTLLVFISSVQKVQKELEDERPDARHSTWPANGRNRQIIVR